MKSANKDTHFMSTVKVGPKGQIVIPKEIRDMFSIAPGDNLVILADANRGIAIERQSFLFKVADAILGGRGAEEYPAWTDEHAESFAAALKELEGEA